MVELNESEPVEAATVEARINGESYLYIPASERPEWLNPGTTAKIVPVNTGEISINPIVRNLNGSYQFPAAEMLSVISLPPWKDGIEVLLKEDNGDSE